MATELKATSTFALTQYCGPLPHPSGDRRRLQVTQEGMPTRLVNMSKPEALELARALLDWVSDDREVAQ